MRSVSHRNPDARKRRLVAILTGALVALSVLLYDPTRLENTSGDTISSRYWPVAILKHHTITLNPFKQELNGVAYAAVGIGENWYPRSFLGMAAFTVPFYAFVDLFTEEWTHDHISRVSRANAIFLAVAATVLLFRFLLRFASPVAAFLSTLAFAFGTWHWSLGAQGLSNQVASVLIMVLILPVFHALCAEERKKALERASVALGLLHGLLWVTRPQDIYLVFPMVLVFRSWAQRLRYGAAALAIVAPVTWLNVEIFGSWIGYGGALLRATLEHTGESITIYRMNFPAGLAGLLVSPNRGAIVFLPLLFLVPLLWRRLLPALGFGELFDAVLSLRIPKFASRKLEAGMPSAFWRAIGIGLVFYFTTLCFLEFWHSTWSYGARYLYDLLPYAWLPLTLGFEDLLRWREKKKARFPYWIHITMIVLTLQGVLVHALGHRNFYIYVWNYPKQATEERIWDLSDFMLSDVWAAGPSAERWRSALQRLKDYGF
ncbi:MAG: hypothetical protein NDJ89_10750 [Oligoflexia bacterium]|nr:hypothetical protein [Oligoflexia bacterium]